MCTLPLSIMTYFLSILFCLQYVYGQNVPIVNTTQGLVRGLESDVGDYYMYLGIPYGLVNTENPFGPSSPYPAFEGIFNATDDTAMCPQLDFNSGTLLGSLSCLHLSVFTPASGTNRPVMVFIHGGAFEVGFYGSMVYNPNFLVRHGITIVTLNYRLGPFGFMCTDNERVPGNQGLKDQLMALRWINENIESFGGDPSRVTLVGSSAGATSVDLQIIRDHTPKLFNQVIFQSGTSFMPFYIPTVRNAPLIISKHLGFRTDNIQEAFDFISNIEPRDIIRATTDLSLQFGPCVEKSFEDVEAFVTENWMLKDVIPSAKGFKAMIGFNDNEALGLFVAPGQDFSNVVQESLRPTFDIHNEDFQGMSSVRHFFFGDDEINSDKFQQVIDLRSDLSFVYLSMRSIGRFLRSEVEKVYLYVFAYDGERNILKNRLNTTHGGAAHGDEIGYLWGVSYLGEPTGQDQTIVDRMTTMWANFVKYGDPTPESTDLLPVKWDPITATTDHYYMHIDDELQVATRPFSERMAFWDLFYEINRHLELYMIDF